MNSPVILNEEKDLGGRLKEDPDSSLTLRMTDKHSE